MEQHREECRDQRRLNLIDHLVQDLRYAFRILIKNPGFTGTAVIALAIGIGANVAMFSVVNSVLLRPLPHPSSDKLMTLWKWRFPGGGVNASPSEFLAWRNQSRSFSAVAAYLRQTLNLSGQGNPEQISLRPRNWKLARDASPSSATNCPGREWREMKEASDLQLTSAANRI